MMNIEIKKATNKDESQILEIYHSLIGTFGWTWSVEYPTIEDIINDNRFSRIPVYEEMIL